MPVPIGAEQFVPDSTSLRSLRAAAASCQGCDLYRDASRTVFGAGLKRARIMMLGEQPGDQEDRQGKPFVGPAGRILDRALEEVDIDRDEVYLTNVVKHFKFTREEGRKRRIHQKPNQVEILACRPWWMAELHAVRPEVVVCLGATAAQAVLGSDFRVTKQRGEIVPVPDAPKARGIATVHPSSVLRAPDRDSAYAGFRDDLAVVAGELR
ncbi:MAG TPA: UdgX family uracil-DNA binding protein [Mycobacteriales bacterium]|nr:UdgX family uracil-DNA binding protein [Mycobacteriales bacterium]